MNYIKINYHKKELYLILIQYVDFLITFNFFIYKIKYNLIRICKYLFFFNIRPIIIFFSFL